MKPDFVSVGRLGAPKGVRGDLKVHSYSGESAHFRDLKDVELRPGVGQAPADSSKAPRAALRLNVLRVEGDGPSLTMAFEGYPSPETARALTGFDIVVPRAQASRLKPDEWYIDDLVGLSFLPPGRKALDGAKALAMVASVLEGGAEPWLEAALPDGRKAIVPFRRQYVGEVDLAAGTIELLLPELLDE